MEERVIRMITEAETRPSDRAGRNMHFRLPTGSSEKGM